MCPVSARSLRKPTRFYRQRLRQAWAFFFSDVLLDATRAERWLQSDSTFQVEDFDEPSVVETSPAWGSRLAPAATRQAERRRAKRERGSAWEMPRRVERLARYPRADWCCPEVNRCGLARGGGSVMLRAVQESER
jgi:hypothetical protein